MIKTWEHQDFSVGQVADAGNSISICLPARNEAATITQIVTSLTELASLLPACEIVVVDDRSEDDTYTLAKAAGATVYRSSELMLQQGQVRGKGDVMWRSLSVLSGEIVVFLDADVANFENHFVTGLVGPLLQDSQLAMVKASYRRPLKTQAATLQDQGGRVTSLLARPLLRRYFPELAEVEQPLSGEVAVRRSHAQALGFQTGYGVEIGMLIDTYLACGSESIGQTRLGIRYHRNRQLSELERMSDQVLAAVMRRSGPLGPGQSEDADTVRPPHRELVTK